MNVGHTLQVPLQPCLTMLAAARLARCHAVLTASGQANSLRRRQQLGPQKDVGESTF